MNNRGVKRPWYQFSLASLFLLTTLVGVWFAVAPRMRAYYAVQRLSNRDVQADGNFLGLDVRIDGETAEEILQLGKVANPALQAALDDPSKFAAAHVLLTRINEQSHPFSASHWNGLQISLHADGRVDFHPEQRSKLMGFWNSRLSGKSK